MAPNQIETFPGPSEQSESVPHALPDQHNCTLRQPDPLAGGCCAGTMVENIDGPVPSPHASRITHHEASARPWFIAADIALALGAGWHKKKVHRIAQREQWPVRQVANRLEYQPPKRVAEIVLQSPCNPSAAEAPTIKFTDFAGGDRQRELTLWREEAVNLYHSLIAESSSQGVLSAFSLVAKHFKQERPLFRISEASLRVWVKRYAAFGLDGLVEQKRGACGRKPITHLLEPSHLLRAAAGAVESGIKGRLNIARSYRNNLVANPNLPGPARLAIHGDTASKSHVPKSIRSAVQQLACEDTAKLLQVGPKAMKLDGAYSECSYDNLKPGQAFTADDATANAYVWVEWPCEAGFIVLRPQILAAMDVGSMYWLSVRVVVRPKGQYGKDDVWGLIGDVLDRYGKFETAILEGGSWQSNVVIGERTGYTDADRFGGLKSLGIQVIHTRTPHGKIIETGWN